MDAYLLQEHLSAIDQLPSNLDFDVLLLSEATGLSQDLDHSGLRSQPFHHTHCVCFPAAPQIPHAADKLYDGQRRMGQDVG